MEESFVGDTDAEDVVSDVSTSSSSGQSLGCLLKSCCAVEIGKAEDGEKRVPEGVTGAGFQRRWSRQSLDINVLVICQRKCDINDQLAYLDKILDAMNSIVNSLTNFTLLEYLGSREHAVVSDILFKSRGSE